MNHYSAFYEVLTLSIEGAVVFVLLLCIEFWRLTLDKWMSLLEHPHELHFARPPAQHRAGKLEDTDVTQEDKMVSELAAGKVAPSTTTPFMFAHRLSKAYGYLDSHAVLQASGSRYRAELANQTSLPCEHLRRISKGSTHYAARDIVGTMYFPKTKILYGSLSLNYLGVGARPELHCPLRRVLRPLGRQRCGKDDRVRILTGELLPHEGDAVAAGFSVVRHRQHFQHFVGYCPQRDGLLDMLTGIETILLFGRLSGVSMTAEYLDAMLEVFHLDEIGEQLVSTYSAGNKRKLSLCISMLGLPRLILLDEPYATIATTSRRRIVNYISALQKVSKPSIVLSSHSLVDVEFLCNRIAILGGGHLQCLGSLAHLKQKFGKGYTISVKTYPDRKQDVSYQRLVAADVRKNFKEVELVHSYEGLLEFRMSNVRMMWSEMFTRMARIKKKFKLQDFFITDTSLEQIFLSVTRKEASEAAAAAVALATPGQHRVIAPAELGI
ncbi:hypothetical protein HPB50_005002 [Hyalomma asiaticum]|uniref:Uncharacterized protein n=1 Tax=Hyalomma asiaticum TaxID=266040 RepID=A0ACB7RHR5_HYAAI|nr:hypothetical protein HPB50_005002 [Hyalomma asiaticum]